jgi:CheY-like chemotaxis protein
MVMATHRHRVLIVDDDLPFAESLRTLLEPEFDVVLAGDAGEGLFRLERECFCATIFDLDLPPVLSGGGPEEGVSLALQTRSRWGEDLPIVVLSRRVPEHLRAALGKIANAVLEKPPSPERIVTYLREWMVCANRDG